jgi:hypothetical protein
MTLFDFTFGLSAIILGLGLAEMFSRFQQLVFAGRRVKWAAEPVLLSAMVFLVILVVWLGSWTQRGIRQITVGEVALNVFALLWLFMVAAAVFPRPSEDRETDLHAYYDGARRFLFGALLIAQLLYWVVGLMARAGSIHGLGAWAAAVATSAPYYDAIPYAALMFIRWRWFNIAALLFISAIFAPYALSIRLTG